MRTLKLAILIAALALPAQAADRRMVTYDAASPDAQRLTGAGLTFVFTRSMLRQRVLAVRATAVPVGVVVEPSTDGRVNDRLDALLRDEARTGALYRIDPEAEQGKVMVQAFCPGSTQGWLSIGTIAHARPIRVHAFGDDPASGEPRLCASMDFDYRGEWRMPPVRGADPTRDAFNAVAGAR